MDLLECLLQELGAFGAEVAVARVELDFLRATKFLVAQGGVLRRIAVSYLPYTSWVTHRAPARDEDTVGLLENLWQSPEDRAVWQSTMYGAWPYRLDQLLERTPESLSAIVAELTGPIGPRWLIDDPAGHRRDRITAGLLQLAARPKARKMVERQLVAMRKELLDPLQVGLHERRELHPSVFVLDELVSMLAPSEEPIANPIDPR